MTRVPFNFPAHPDPDKAPDQEVLEQRRFTPEQHEAILQVLRIACQIGSDEDVPPLFRLPVAVVMTHTTFSDLAVRYRVPENHKHPRHQALDHALKLYCTSSQYSHAMITGDRRYTLDMEPGDPLTDADRQSGENRLRACRDRPERARQTLITAPNGPGTWRVRRLDAKRLSGRREFSSPGMPRTAPD